MAILTCTYRYYPTPSFLRSFKRRLLIVTWPFYEGTGLVTNVSLTNPEPWRERMAGISELLHVCRLHWPWLLVFSRRRCLRQVAQIQEMEYNPLGCLQHFVLIDYPSHHETATLHTCVRCLQTEALLGLGLTSLDLLSLDPVPLAWLVAVWVLGLSVMLKLLSRYASKFWMKLGEDARIRKMSGMISREWHSRLGS